MSKRRSEIIICCGRQTWTAKSLPGVYFCGNCGAVLKVVEVENSSKMAEFFNRKISNALDSLKRDDACDFLMGKTVKVSQKELEMLLMEGAIM